MNQPTAADIVTALGGFIADDLDSPNPPCDCPPFGTPEYLDLIAKRHAKP